MERHSWRGREVRDFQVGVAVVHVVAWLSVMKQVEFLQECSSRFFEDSERACVRAFVPL
tara:strand:+ start:688 stop:864 length:177 start_codon:yes stop_codon:yes gene_type:complete